MTAKTTAAGVPYDIQGDMSDTDRRDAAMRGFVHDFGAVAAAHLESCVHCGMCAEACHFYVSTGESEYTPIWKLSRSSRPISAYAVRSRRSIGCSHRAQGDGH